MSFIYRPRMETRADQLRKKFSGWSEVTCDTCGKLLTNAQVQYCEANAVKFNDKKVCRFCQGLERYKD